MFWKATLQKHVACHNSAFLEIQLSTAAEERASVSNGSVFLEIQLSAAAEECAVVELESALCNRRGAKGVLGTVNPDELLHFPSRLITGTL